MDVSSPTTQFSTRDRCPACGSAEARRLVDLSYSEPPISDYLLRFYGSAGREMLAELADVDYTLIECVRCGLIWQYRSPHEGFLRQLYETWSDPAETRELELGATLGERLPVAREVASVVSALGRRPNELRVLDFGMGWGWWLQIARAFGCQVWGVEVSPPMLEHAVQLGIPTLSWDELGDHQFDFVNTEQVFEHLAEPFPVLQRLAKTLSPEGLLKISVPPSHDIHRRLRANDWDAGKWTRNSLNAVAPLEHLNCFHGRSLPAMAERAGLDERRLPTGAYYELLALRTGFGRLAKQILKPVFPTRKGAYRFFGHR
ncbi:MAG: class I SAM-dependent methyltransferase [Gaiellaceae bacterium]